MRYLNRIFAGLFFILLLSLLACNKKDPGTANDVAITEESVVLNPTGFSPLTAVISFKTSEAVKVSIHIKGKYGGFSDVVKDLDSIKTIHHVPIYGLYPDFENTVELNFRNSSGI